MTSTTMDAKNDESTTCHALPCNIEFTGKAPVYLYFQPHPVESNNTDNDTSTANTSSSSSSSTTCLQAAQFRGRGLLACTSSPQETVHGRLLQVHDKNSSSNNNTGGVSVQASFEHLTEWHHEHQPAAVHAAMQKHDRVKLARDWFPVAAALHAPGPVPVVVTNK
jgi:hypothetical protein